MGADKHISGENFNGELFKQKKENAEGPVPLV